MVPLPEFSVNVPYASIKRSSWISPVNFTRCLLSTQICLCVCSQTGVPFSQSGYLILSHPTHDRNVLTWRMKQGVCLCRTWASWHAGVGRTDQGTQLRRLHGPIRSAKCVLPESYFSGTEQEALRKTGSFSRLLPPPTWNLIHLMQSQQSKRACVCGVCVCARVVCVWVRAREGHLEFNGFKVCLGEYPPLGMVWFLRWSYWRKAMLNFSH